MLWRATGFFLNGSILLIGLLHWSVGEADYCDGEADYCDELEFAKRDALIMGF